MKISKIGIPALTVLTASAGIGMAQEDLTLNFGPLVGSQIVFNGSADSFNFTPGTSSPYQWQITSEDGTADTGSAQSDLGSILGGAFSYGPTITTSGPIQSATVNAPNGQLVISDGLGTLTGIIDFEDVSTYQESAGFFNADLQINLTDVIYSGSQQDLLFLTANQPGIVDLTFQFAPGKNLTQLSTGSTPFSTSYSGSIYVEGSVIPEPSPLLMSALGGLGALGIGFRSWKKA